MIAPVLSQPRRETRQSRDYVSWSAINTYLQCPLRYRFRYVDQLPEEFVNGALVFGQAIHAALEAYFRHYEAAGKSLGLDPLLEAYHDTWRQRELAQVRFGAHDDLNSFRVLAEKMLTVFLPHDLAQPLGAIIGVEKELRSRLIDEAPDLLARLDLVVDEPEAVMVTDFKTSRSRWSAADVELAAGQVLLYGELVRLALDRPVRLQFAVLTKTKQPELKIHEVANDAGRTARQQALIRRVWRSIQGGHFYPHPSAMNCPTCPFQSACRDWGG